MHLIKNYELATDADSLIRDTIAEYKAMYDKTVDKHEAARLILEDKSRNLSSQLEETIRALYTKEARDRIFGSKHE